MITVTVSDLIYINEAAKALKQKDFCWIDNTLIGVDDFNYAIYCKLDAYKISVIPRKGLYINQKELSAFIKNITVEEGFNIADEYNTGATTTLFTNNLAELEIHMNPEMDIRVYYQLAQISKINMLMQNIPEQDVTARFADLYKMPKGAGVTMYHYDATHIMAIFGGIVPLLTADKLYMKLYDDSPATFLVQFRVDKKNKFEVFVYLMYLKI